MNFYDTLKKGNKVYILHRATNRETEDANGIKLTRIVKIEVCTIVEVEPPFYGLTTVRAVSTNKPIETRFIYFDEKYDNILKIKADETVKHGIVERECYLYTTNKKTLMKLFREILKDNIRIAKEEMEKGTISFNRLQGIIEQMRNEYKEKRFEII